MAANSGKTPFFIVIILLLLLINAALFYLNQQEKQSNVEKTEVIEDLSNDIANKKELLTAQRDSMESLLTQVVGNDSLTTEMTAEIGKLNNFITSLEKKNNFNKRKLEEAQTQVNYYAKVVDNFQLQIGQLKMANERMAEQIRIEQEDKNRLVAEVEATKANVATLESEKEEVINEKSQLSEEKESLEERLALASVLQLSRNYIKGYKTNRRGKTVYVDKAKKAERLEVCIEIMPNTEATQGNQDFTVIITNPQGQVVPASTDGSGDFTTADGEYKRYTEIMTAAYNGKKGIFCNNWAEDNYRAGKYTLDVYNKGHLVGSSNVILQ